MKKCAGIGNVVLPVIVLHYKKQEVRPKPVRVKWLYMSSSLVMDEEVCRQPGCACYNASLQGTIAARQKPVRVTDYTHIHARSLWTMKCAGNVVVSLYRKQENQWLNMNEEVRPKPVRVTAIKPPVYEWRNVQATW